MPADRTSSAGPVPRTDASQWAALAGLLWSERDLLTHLLAAPAAPAILTLQEVEVLRAAEVEAITRSLGIGPDVTLRELAQLAPPPWGLLLAEHREALQQLIRDVDAVFEPARLGQLSLLAFLG
jgi:hypothetical protein